MEKHRKTCLEQDLLESKSIHIETFYGFPLNVLKLKEGGFKTVSSFFSDEIEIEVSKSASIALSKGRHLVYTLINFEEKRVGMLSQKGIQYLTENKDLECPHPALRTDKV